MCKHQLNNYSCFPYFSYINSLSSCALALPFLLSLTVIAPFCFAFIFCPLESSSPLLSPLLFSLHYFLFFSCLTASSLLFALLPLPFLHSLHIPLLLVSSLISPLCFTSVLLACPFLSPAICLSNMAVPSQLGAFPGNKTSNTVPPQLNGPQFCFCHSCYMQRD